MRYDPTVARMPGVESPDVRGRCFRNGKNNARSFEPLAKLLIDRINIDLRERFRKVLPPHVHQHGSDWNIDSRHIYLKRPIAEAMGYLLFTNNLI